MHLFILKWTGESGKVYYQDNIKDECGLTGELVSIVGHKPHQNFAWNCERCEERCDKCDNIIHSDVHLPTNCPCYCPHCDTTADR